MSMFDELARPFPESAIRWRVGSTNGDKTQGIALAYVDARDVYDRLDDVVGPGNWQDRYPFEGCCEIGIRINGEWIWKSNGAGKTDIEGDKGQYSDSFKRAGVLWGIARYLYGLPNAWVPIKPRGRSYVLAETPKLPMKFTQAGWDRIDIDIRKKLREDTLEALQNGDADYLITIWDEFTHEEHLQLWPMFDSKERSAIKALKE